MVAMKKGLTAIILAITCFFFSQADSFYWDNFHSFHPFLNASQNGLNITNKTHLPTFDTISSRIGLCDFSFETRLSSINNKPNKRYKYSDADGSTKHVKHPSWGIVAFDSLGNKLELRISTSQTSDWEYSSADCLNIALIHNDSIIAQSRCIYPDIEPFTGLNTICLCRQNSTVCAKIGARTKKEIISADIDGFFISSIGFTTYPAANIKIDRIALTITNPPSKNLTTNWSDESISKHISESIDPLEGYWASLDRSLDEDLLRMGGNYSLAMIKNDNGYYLIYVGGATINPESWKTGMIKATLTPTKFNGTYNVIWYDSAMRPLHKDITAHIESNHLMLIAFPYQSSHIRLTRTPTP